MNDNELKTMEQESAELFALLSEVRDEDNASVRIAPCPCPGKKRSLRISPYGLVAASVLGFVFGMSVPRGNGCYPKDYTALLADTSYMVGRSLASGDVNFALLIK